MKTQHPYTPPKQAQLSYRLYAALEAEPVENGMNHPAEEIIAEALRHPEDRQVLECLENLSLDAERPGTAAAVLRCVGRQQNPASPSWRAGLVRMGLASENVEIRDAGAQAAESWGGREMAEILREHRETEPWLRNYILDVIKDLGNESVPEPGRGARGERRRGKISKEPE